MHNLTFNQKNGCALNHSYFYTSSSKECTISSSHGSQGNPHDEETCVDKDARKGSHIEEEKIHNWQQRLVLDKHYFSI